MRNKLSLLALGLAVASLLSGCVSSHATADDPATGRWTTVSVDGQAVGDVWCIQASSYSVNTFDCEWASFTGANTHKDTLGAQGEYRYVLAANGSEQRLLCINYVMRKGYRVVNCNWESLRNR